MRYSLSVLLLLFSVSCFGQDYPFDLTLKWTNPTHNTDDSVLTDLATTRIVCERDSVQVIDDSTDSEGYEGQVQNFTISITADGLMTCRAYAINKWGVSSDASNEFSLPFGPPAVETEPNAIIDLTAIRQ